MVNKCRISARRYCGKWHADITADSVTLCEISTCGYFCGYFIVLQMHFYYLRCAEVGHSRCKSFSA